MKTILLALFLTYAFIQTPAYGATDGGFWNDCPGLGCPANGDTVDGRINENAPSEYIIMDNEHLQKELEHLEESIKDIKKEQKKRDSPDSR